MRYGEQLNDDPEEHEICNSMAREYRQKKRKEQIHSINRRYSGEENESKFNDHLGELIDNKSIAFSKWISYHEKGEFDFAIQLPDASYIYIDVVGSHMRGNTVMLNCKHKNWKNKMKFLRDEGYAIGYLAFLYENQWRYMRIHRKLPIGDLSLTKGRNKHIKTEKNILNMYPGGYMVNMDFAEDEEDS